MGIEVNTDVPLTKAEKEWLTERRREGEIAVNDRRFAGLSTEEKKALRARATEDQAYDDEQQRQWEEQVAKEQADSYPDELIDKVAPLTTAQLRLYLEKRQMDATGTKEELQVRILDHMMKSYVPS